MKNPRFAFAFAAALAVSGGALYEAGVTHAESCAAMQKEADRAAQAPIRPNSTAELGFTPMDQFEKVYPPVCPPRDEDEDLFSALLAGAGTWMATYFLFGLLGRLLLVKKPH
jgi:hypothetical protein